VYCEGACAYKGEAHWRASRLVWTDAIKVELEWPVPIHLKGVIASIDHGQEEDSMMVIGKMSDRTITMSMQVTPEGMDLLQGKHP
jgi:hypothetical protein